MSSNYYYESHKILRELGLKDTMANIYLFLIKNGSSTILEISRGTGISRSNVYYKINELKQNHLVTEGVNKNKRVIIPESPHNIINLLKNKERLAKNSINLLNEGFIKNRTNISLKFFYGCDGFKKCLSNIVNANTKEILQITNNNMSRFVSEKYINNFERSRIKKRIYSKVLMPYSDTEIIKKNTSEIQIIKQNREIRFMPHDIKFKMSIIFYKQSVYFFTSPEEGYILYIDSKSVSDSFYSIFNKIWNNSTPLKDNM